jgi:dTDP-4-amino-4,6-dideoxygalactose transaminase
MQKPSKPTYVTVPSLCPIDEFVEVLRSAWESRILTHNGPLVQKLEKEISGCLKINDTAVVTNGTIALQLAIRSLKLKGEIITTPFSWIATASAIQWENCSPVFVDINPDTLNIDPEKIEAAITHRTSAIMPVHVFSNPVEITAINEIAKKYNLKVIYDAAHAFGVNYNGKSVMEYGDISCTSLHATKIFNTGEGGACFSQDPLLLEKIKNLRFFGHDLKKEIVDEGLNGKMTEIHAALGLANLPYLNGVIKKREDIYSRYANALEGYKGLRLQSFNKDEYNYSYMPIILQNEKDLIDLDDKLKQNNIFARRYFYPSLNTIKAVMPYQPVPVSEDIAKRILCLPSHNDLSIEDIDSIIKTIKD